MSAAMGEPGRELAATEVEAAAAADLAGWAADVRLVAAGSASEAVAAVARLAAAGADPARITVRGPIAAIDDLRAVAATGVRRIQWPVRADLDGHARGQLARQVAIARSVGLAAEAAPPRRRGVTWHGDAAEVRGLRMGIREAWRLRVPVADVPEFVAAAARDGLCVALSAATFAAEAGGRLRSAGDGPHLAVVARSAPIARERCDMECRLVELTGEVNGERPLVEMVALHRALGAAYGFPSCCVEAFVDAFCEIAATDRPVDNPLAIARAARRSAAFDPRLHTLVADLGERPATPLRHLPCRFDCAESRSLADRLGATSCRAVNVVALEDGAWIECDGRPDRGDWRATLVTGITRMRLRGTTPLAAAWHAAAAERGPIAVAIRRGRAVEWSRDGRSRRIGGAGRDARFPVLLPFAFSAP